MTEMSHIAIPAQAEAAITELIERNRESLIRATIADPATRDSLLEIQRQITDLAGRDPDVVAAWGLGCGAGCLTNVGVAGNVGLAGATVVRR
jgi:hypothetical protein